MGGSKVPHGRRLQLGYGIDTCDNGSVKHPRPFHQEVELRAYELWQERGRPWATPETDWFRAEQEMTGAKPEGGLTRVAREVGTAIGTVVALVTAAEPPS